MIKQNTSWSERTLYDRLNDRWTQIDSKMSTFQVNRDIISTYFRPDLDTEVQGNDTFGNILGRKVYEGTPAHALHVASTGLRGNTVSESLDWIKYQMGQFELRGVDKLDAWCQDIKDHMQAVYRSSNFYQVQQGFTKDALSIGSPFMFIEESSPVTGIIKCLPQHCKHCRVAYNKYNEMEGVFVLDPTWSAKQIFDRFCKGDTNEERMGIAKEKLSTTLINAIENGTHTDEYRIFRAVFRKDDPIWIGIDFKVPSGDYQYLGVWFEYDTVKYRNDPLEIERFFGRPGVVWDYDKRPYEPCSRTPCYYALWDVVSLQDSHKNFLENNQLKTNPPRYYLKAMANRLKLGPKGLIPLSREEYQCPPKTLDLIGDIAYNEKMSEMLGKAVERHLHTDSYNMITQLTQGHPEKINDLHMLQLIAEKSTMLSPEIETQQKYLSDCDERFVGIEANAGRGPFAPDVMANITDIIMSNIKNKNSIVSVQPQFMGILYQAQRMTARLAPIQKGLEFIAQAAQVLGLTATKIVKPYQLLDKGLSALDFPDDAKLEEKDFNNIIAAMQQKQAQDEAFMKTIEAAKASKGLNKSIEPNSPMENMSKAMAGSAA